jgi:nucleoside-triphosphatase THEP1
MRQNLALALQEEIRLRKDSPRILVRSLRANRTETGQYFIPKERAEALKERTSATLIGPNGHKNVNIVSIDGGYLIDADDAGGSPFLTGQLVEEDSVQLESALNSLANSKDEKGLAKKLFAAEGALCFDDQIDEDSPLSAAQKLAVKAALGSEVCFVIGPPGTGKTTVIQQIIAECAKRGERVLIASHTRAAIENVFETRHGVANPLANFSEDRMVIDFNSERLKSYSAKERIRAKQVVLEEKRVIVEDSIRESEAEVQRYRDQYAEIQRENNAIKKELTKIAANRASAEASFLEAKQNYDKALKKCVSVENNLARKMLAAAIGKKDLAMGEHAKHLEEAKAQLDEREKLLAEITAQEAQKQGELRDSDLKVIHIEADKVKEAIQFSCDMVKEILAEIAALNHEAIISDAQIVGSTLAACSASKRFAKQRFDAVIVDEASMASLPALYLAANLADKRVIVVGDPAQLSPIAQTEALKRSIYEVTEVGKSFYEGQMHPLSVMLDEQHRCRAAIGSLVSRVFYSGRLKNSRGSDALRQGTPSLIFMKGSAAGCAREFVGKVGSIGIITPFRKSVERIKASMGDMLEKENIQVDTVHRFQGSERNVIILDLAGIVTSAGELSIMIAGESASSAARLLNVASTRARDYLVVLADVDYILRAINERYGDAAPRQILYVWLNEFKQLHAHERKRIASLHQQIAA